MFQPIFRNIEIDEENGSQLFLKTSLCLDIPLVFCIFPLVAGYWMKHSHWWFVFHFSCPDIRQNAPSSVWYITSESLDITRDSAIRFWTHAVSNGMSDLTLPLLRVCEISVIECQTKHCHSPSMDNLSMSVLTSDKTLSDVFEIFAGS